MSLVCIFDRAYGINLNTELQRSLAELIYLPHIHNVFVDTDSANSSKIIGAESDGTNSKLQIYARHIYPNVLTDKQDALKQYLTSDSLKETIKVYVAPSKDAMNDLLKNTTGIANTGDKFDYKNTVYILCHADSLENLINVLKTMEFKVGNYLSEVTTDGIHPILKQIVVNAKDINIRVQKQYGGSDSTSSETQRLLKPESEIEPAPPSGTNRIQNVAEKQEPLVLQTGTKPIKTIRKTAKNTSIQRKTQKSIVTIMGKGAGNTKMPGNALLGSSNVIVFNSLSDDTIYIIAPDVSDLDTSNIFKSLVKFFKVKPDTSVKVKNIEKGRPELPKKREPRNLSAEAEEKANDVVLEQAAVKAKLAIPETKKDIKQINLLLQTVKTDFEKAKKEYLKDSENARVYKQYILPFVKPGKGLILDELLDKLQHNILTKDESAAILQAGILISNTDTETTDNLHEKIKQIIAKYKYTCKQNQDSDSFGSLLCYFMDNNEKKTVNKDSNPNTKYLNTLVSGTKKAYDFALVLKYINMHNYYNSKVLYYMDLLSEKQVAKKQYENIKTLKVRPSIHIPIQKGQIIPAANVESRKKTIKAAANYNVLSTIGVKAVENRKSSQKRQNQPQITRESRKAGVKHALKYLFNKKYRAARAESKEEKMRDYKKKLVSKLKHKISGSFDADAVEK